VIELRVSDGVQRLTLECEAVLFDMDGTLVDSNACVEATWRAWAARHSLDADALIRIGHGRQNHETLRLVAPHLETPQELASLAAAEENCREGIVEVPGARELLERLPPERWAVVTSAWRRLATIRLECARLPVPPVLVTADQVARGKPDPEGYLLAAARLGVDPTRCVVVEDSPAGIEAAKAAGMRVIGIATTFSRPQLGCSPCIDDFRDITGR
jgi:sugar-phosphatase